MTPRTMDDLAVNKIECDCMSVSKLCGREEGKLSKGDEGVLTIG